MDNLAFELTHKEHVTAIGLIVGGAIVFILSMTLFYLANRSLDRAYRDDTIEDEAFKRRNKK